MNRDRVTGVLRTISAIWKHWRGTVTGQDGDSGRWGEKMAECELRRKGYRILGRRVRVGRRDEIDLVARDQDVLVFVEVKTRRREDFGMPIDSVDRRKRVAQSRAAVRYLKRIGSPRIPFRFDVVEVVGSPGEGVRTLRHVEKAFVLDSRYMLPG